MVRDFGYLFIFENDKHLKLGNKVDFLSVKEGLYSISRRELWQENRSFIGNYWYYQRLFKIDLK